MWDQIIRTSVTNYHFSHQELGAPVRQLTLTRTLLVFLFCNVPLQHNCCPTNGPNFSYSGWYQLTQVVLEKRPCVWIMFI